MEHSMNEGGHTPVESSVSVDGSREAKEIVAKAMELARKCELIRDERAAFSLYSKRWRELDCELHEARCALESFLLRSFEDRAALSSSQAAAREILQLDAYAEGRRDEQEELASVLPGTTYMDPPDGGAPTILEQLQRQAKDARRYLWIRNSDGEYESHPAIQAMWAALPPHLSYPTPQMWDDAIDAAMASPTPVQKG